METARQPMLDVVRGVAILLVLGFHFRVPLGSGWLDAGLQPVFAIGWLGVDLFFVLSGFLVGRHLLAEMAETGRLDRGRFVLRRARRLWPMLWLYLAVLLLLGGGAAWAQVRPVLLHVQNFSNAAPSHLWSLAVEEHFYLLAALALPALWRRGGMRLVGGAIVALLALCLSLRLLALSGGVPLLYLQWQTVYRLDAPAFGVLLALLARVRPPWFAAAGSRPALLLLAAVAGAFLIGASSPAQQHGWGYTIAYLAAGAIVIAAAAIPAGARIALPCRALAALGRISYPLYIWHASIGATVRAILPERPVLALLVSLATSIGAAVLLHRWLDQPIQKKLFLPARPLRRSRSLFIAIASVVQ